jgi:hypothetical protein
MAEEFECASKKLAENVLSTREVFMCQWTVTSSNNKPSVIDAFNQWGICEGQKASKKFLINVEVEDIVKPWNQIVQ